MNVHHWLINLLPTFHCYRPRFFVFLYTNFLRLPFCTCICHLYTAPVLRFSQICSFSLRRVLDPLEVKTSGAILESIFNVLFKVISKSLFVKFRNEMFEYGTFVQKQICMYFFCKSKLPMSKNGGAYILNFIKISWNILWFQIDISSLFQRNSIPIIRHT